jgi:EAL domain-containing protein (putative c-di-GMP-specific phosphodiesterase class I)
MANPGPRLTCARGTPAGRRQRRIVFARCVVDAAVPDRYHQDRSLLCSPSASEDQAIAQAIISVGKPLGTTIVAEGVETADQESLLRDHAGDEMQVFLFGKLVPPQCVPDLLRAPLRVSPPLQPEPFTDRRVSKALR